MRGTLTLLSILIVFQFSIVFAEIDSESQDMTDIPLVFTKNMGQWPDHILYRADVGATTMWFRHDGVYYQIGRFLTGKDELTVNSSARFTDVDLGGLEGDHPAYEESAKTMIKATFFGANPGATVEGEGLLELRCNYFLGSDRSRWRTDVPNYEAIVLRDIYPGIDLHYTAGAHGGISQKFVAEPVADLSQIEIVYEGDGDVLVDAKGRLTIETATGQFLGHLVENDNDEMTPELRSLSTGSIGLMAGSRSGGENGLRNITLEYSTFLGGSNIDYGIGIAVDVHGCAYVFGETQSADFPTENPYDPDYNEGRDVFVAKLSESGSSLIYCTYLGSPDDDYRGGIAVDALGCAYIIGYTWSPDYPTANAYDDTHNGSNDYFITKLSPTGNSLEYSTFLGGTHSDKGMNITVDAEGNAYVLGYVRSTDFPTQNAYDPTHPDTLEIDVAVTKLSADGSSLVYSTYLGGSDWDKGFGIAIDTFGCTYVLGTTFSPDFPMANAYDATIDDSLDAFVAKLSADGNTLVYSTFLGGSDDDWGVYGIQVDVSGCAYVVGETESGNFPTASAYDDNLGGIRDAFVTKLSAAGNSLVYSTYLGGSGADAGRDLALDESGCAYVTGTTESVDFPVKYAFDSIYEGDYGDAFLTRLSPDGGALVYSTYLGDTFGESGEGVVLDNSTCAYITGMVSLGDFPVVNAYDPTYNGYGDAFVTKFAAFTWFHAGDANNDGEANIGDAVYIINHAFKGGPAPDPIEACDSNCDVECNVGDAVYMINHVFKGGPPPGDGCE
ncbi:MAG: SBBP repeat-containing protein [Candidatus Zixiibacteriota bacterium]